MAITFKLLFFFVFVNGKLAFIEVISLICLLKLLPEVFQNRAMDIVFHYLDYQTNIDVRLGFAAVRVRKESFKLMYWTIIQV